MHGTLIHAKLRLPLKIWQDSDPLFSLKRSTLKKITLKLTYSFWECVVLHISLCNFLQFHFSLWMCALTYLVVWMCAFTGSFSNYSYSFGWVLSFKTHTRLCKVASIGEKITEDINHGLHSREKHMNTETDHRNRKTTVPYRDQTDRDKK